MATPLVQSHWSPENLLPSILSSNGTCSGRSVRLFWGAKSMRVNQMAKPVGPSNLDFSGSECCLGETPVSTELCSTDQEEGTLAVPVGEVWGPVQFSCTCSCSCPRSGTTPAVTLAGKPLPGMEGRGKRVQLAHPWGWDLPWPSFSPVLGEGEGCYQSQL